MAFEIFSVRQLLNGWRKSVPSRRLSKRESTWNGPHKVARKASGHSVVNSTEVDVMRRLLPAATSTSRRNVTKRKNNARMTTSQRHVAVVLGRELDVPSRPEHDSRVLRPFVPACVSQPALLVDEAKCLAKLQYVQPYSSNRMHKWFLHFSPFCRTRWLAAWLDCRTTCNCLQVTQSTLIY